MAKRDSIGKEFPGRRWYVERGKIIEFAKSIRDLNPVYWNPEVAKERGLTDVVAPPTFVMCSGLQAPPGATFMNVVQEAGFDQRRILHGEQEFEFFRPVVAGDQLDSTTRLVDITEREGKRGGKMTMAHTETVYTDQSGATVMVVRNLLIERGAAPAAEA